MAGEFLIVHGEGVPGPGSIEWVLEQRGRPMRIVGPEAAGDAGAARAIIVRGVPEQLWLDALGAAADAGIPILGVGASAEPVARAVGAPIEVAPQTNVSVNVTRTDNAAEHEVAGTLPDGARWLTKATILDPDGWTVLATDENGAPVLLERGSVLITPLVADLRRADRHELVADEPRSLTVARFLGGVANSFVGRWVDRTVGRTEEEAPWGRRGPGPVPGPGLSLNPA